MTARSRTVRTLVVGVALSAATVGLTACGSSAKINPGSPATTQSPSVPSSSATSKAPSGGGAAF